MSPAKGKDLGGMVLAYELVLYRGHCFLIPMLTLLQPPPSKAVIPMAYMKKFSEVVDQIMMSLSLGHLMAAVSHVSTAYRVSPQQWLHSLLFLRCQVYCDLLSLGQREYKNDQIVLISPRVPQAAYFRRKRFCGRESNSIQGKTRVARPFWVGMICEVVNIPLPVWAFNCQLKTLPFSFGTWCLCFCSLGPCISDEDLCF